MAWITDDGSYGTGNVIEFDDNALTNEQWERLDEMSDYERYYYVEEILRGKN